MILPQQPNIRRAESVIMGRSQNLQNLLNRSRVDPRFEKDDTLRENDVRYAPNGAYANGSKYAFVDGLQNYGDSLSERSRAVAISNIDNWGTGGRKTQNATDDEIVHYLNNKLSTDIPSSLKNIIKALIPNYAQGNASNVAVNPDLVGIFKQGFQSYSKKNGDRSVRLTSKWMAKPSQTASGYDKIVLRQAKRIIKRIMNAQAATRMKSDKTLTKEYQAQKGMYNTYKLQYTSSGRLQKLRQYAKKYATTIPGAVLQKQTENLNNYTEALNAGLNLRARRTNQNYQDAIQSAYNAQLEQDLLNRIPLVAGKKPPTVYDNNLYQQKLRSYINRSAGARQYGLAPPPEQNSLSAISNQNQSSISGASELADFGQRAQNNLQESIEMDY